jgi:hypothetical protein
MTSPRKKALVVYETLFGNTRKVAEAIGAGLEHEFDVTVVDVLDAQPAPGEVGLLVVGGPIHAFSMSRSETREDAKRQAAKLGVPIRPHALGIREWLEALEPSAIRVPAAAFDTAVKVGWFTVGSAARAEQSTLEVKGYEVVSRPEHFYVEDLDGPLAVGELERAREWGRVLADTVG